MLALLQQAVSCGVLRELDVQLARLLAGQHPACTLAIAWLSAENGEGHVCLPLSQMTQENLFNGRQTELAAQIWQLAGCHNVSDWRMALSACDNISDGTWVSPLVLDDDRFYLQRMWLDEGYLAQFFSRHQMMDSQHDLRIKNILQQLFPVSSVPSTEINWQKVAAAVAVTSRIAIISGGPGTGKTTTVARLLAALIQLNHPTPLTIALAAPTGKAAARLTESLSFASQALPLDEQQRSLLPQDATTVHRLLGCQPDQPQPYYHQGNRLSVDIVVLDEASMVDMPMMAKLIAALPEHGRLILLGDRDQLASVESGAVLGDLCRFAEQGYSPQRAQQLSQLTGYVLSGKASSEAVSVRDNLCLLRKSYRFDDDSGIGQLAQAVNRGDSQAVTACFQQAYTDLYWHDLRSTEDYHALIACCVDGYQTYLDAITEHTPGTILRLFTQFRLLSALRNGAFGVSGLNDNIEHALLKKGLIRREPFSAWYIGRPVMITRNDSSLNLFNGDIGITLPNDQGDLRVYFQLSDGSIRSILPNRLPAHDTAYAMTVHKSQGSEFDHTLLVLPDSYSPLLSRELIYTAITRARQRLTLFADASILSQAVKRPIRRSSGLTERMIASSHQTAEAG